MDVAVPYNRRIGADQRAGAGQAVTARDALDLVGRPGVVFVDLREAAERARTGEIPGSLHAPYRDLPGLLAPGGLLRHAAGSAGSGARLLFYCAFGERSALAVAAAVEQGIAPVGHLVGGIEAWRQAGGPLAPA
jgi:rhodanese-related sulfurtransferase